MPVSTVEATDVVEEVGAVLWWEVEVASEPFDAFNALRRVERWRVWATMARAFVMCSVNLAANIVSLT